MGTTKKADQSNASALNAEGKADEDVEVVDHIAPDKTAAKADKVTAKAEAAGRKATAKAAAAEEAAAAVAEAKTQEKVDKLFDEENMPGPEPMGSLKPIEYVGETPQAKARQKAELKATLVNLLAFDVKIKNCSDDLREFILNAEAALVEVNCV